MAMRGMSVLGIAETLESKPSTVSTWISKAAKHSEKVNEVVLKVVETPKVEMDEAWTFVGKKTLPREDEYEDKGTWIRIWISMAANCRLVLSHVIGERSQKNADQLVSNTAKKLRSMPLFVTDGLKLYTAALRKQYGKLQQFAPTGKRGRPRSPKLIVNDVLEYAQVIKMRVNGRLNSPAKQAGLIDHVRSLQELLTFPYYKTQTY
jgi:IS1 family transposase